MFLLGEGTFLFRGGTFLLGDATFHLRGTPFSLRGATAGLKLPFDPPGGWFGNRWPPKASSLQGKTPNPRRRLEYIGKLCYFFRLGLRIWRRANEPARRLLHLRGVSVFEPPFNCSPPGRWREYNRKRVSNI